MDRAIAVSGVVVVAIDLRLSEEAPYPASVQDANYGLLRWLKLRAAEWDGDPSKIGVYGSSSGGHVAQLLALRPGDPRYRAIPLPGARASMPRSPRSRRARRSATRTRASSRRSTRSAPR
jgi:acetyl esterase/lipase